MVKGCNIDNKNLIFLDTLLEVESMCLKNIQVQITMTEYIEKVRYLLFSSFIKNPPINNNYDLYHIMNFFKKQ